MDKEIKKVVEDPDKIPSPMVASPVNPEPSESKDIHIPHEEMDDANGKFMDEEDDDFDQEMEIGGES